MNRLLVHPSGTATSNPIYERNCNVRYMQVFGGRCSLKYWSPEKDISDFFVQYILARPSSKVMSTWYYTDLRYTSSIPEHGKCFSVIIRLETIQTICPPFTVNKITNFLQIAGKQHWYWYTYLARKTH